MIIDIKAQTREDNRDDAQEKPRNQKYFFNQPHNLHQNRQCNLFLFGSSFFFDTGGLWRMFQGSAIAFVTVIQ